MNILDKIAAHKIEEVKLKKELTPVKLLEQSQYFESPTISMKKYILRTDKSGIIAEFKRRSPSKPSINLYADPEEITMSYMQGGASALSILTDETFFGGSLKDLNIARQFNFCPILRKDFIIDEYQIIEAKSNGADAILLICEILSEKQVKDLGQFAQSLGLEVLLELHSDVHLSKVGDHIDLLGVNNRDLTTFKVDLQFSVDIASKMNDSFTLVSESGIKTFEEIKMLKSIGFDGFLIGETFMKEAHPGEACRQLSKQILSIHA